jgi:uncharacterized membrane protein YfcA
MLVFLTAMAVGAVTGIFSGWGVGGGTLLILYLTFLAGVDQTTAQGINLLYFLPTSAGAIFLYARQHRLPWKQVVLPCALAGCVTAAAGAFLAGKLDVTLLRRLFGAYLLAAGGVGLLRKQNPPSK